MGRKILFVTTDQQRYDTLQCNGGLLARTPVANALASRGIRYERAIPQSVVCMPSRSTMLTGQYPTTHGVWMNGVPLPIDAPSVAKLLHDSGYRTALIGKAHFEPYFDPFMRFEENKQARLGTTPPGGTHRGFEHLEFATHGIMGGLHYSRWLLNEHPESLGGFFSVLDGDFEVSAQGGGECGAPQVKVNPIPKEWYHTDWVADRTIDWLNSLNQDDNWFCWMSFPDPHHPWDPPESEISRINWKDVDLPLGYPENSSEREAILDAKPRHWKMWYEGELVSNYEAPAKWVPKTLTTDQIREINARNAVEVELIDEALGRVIKAIESRGWSDDVDVIFTTDHGELQGDFGLMFKGPYHVDSLMRLPLIWAPAKNAGIEPSVVAQPVGLIDLAPTFCKIADIDTPDWMQGKSLPIGNNDAEGLDRSPVLTEWDSELFGVGVHLRTITRDNYVLTKYLKGTVHDGSEGELYNLDEDPLQRINLWDDAGYSAIKNELLTNLVDLEPPLHLPRIDLVGPV